MAAVTMPRTSAASVAYGTQRVQELEREVINLRNRLQQVESSWWSAQREITELRRDLSTTFKLLEEAIKARDLAMAALLSSQEAQARANRLLNATQTGAGVGFGAGFFISLVTGLATLPALVFTGAATFVGAAIAQEMTS